MQRWTGFLGSPGTSVPATAWGLSLCSCPTYLGPCSNPGGWGRPDSPASHFRQKEGETEQMEGKQLPLLRMCLRNGLLLFCPLVIHQNSTTWLHLVIREAGKSWWPVVQPLSLQNHGMAEFLLSARRTEYWEQFQPVSQVPQLLTCAPLTIHRTDSCPKETA